MDVLLENQNKSNTPTDQENTQDYKLNIYEIQKSVDFGADYIISHVLKIKKSQEKETKFDTHTFSGTIANCELKKYSTASLKSNSTNFTIISATSHTLPEVRAGPLS